MPRRLGQHFLKDKKALQKIAAALEITSRDTIVEIGPGHRELTEFLVAAAPKEIVAIEKDPRLVSFLKEKFQITNSKLQTNSKLKIPNIKIVEGDVLKILPALVLRLFEKKNSGANSGFKLVGNIPYYLTGYLFRKISELAHSTDAQGKSRMPKLIVFTIQKEVAERICAVPLRRRQGSGGQGRMNLLAASVQFWGEPKIVGYISKKSFRPPPKVDSAIIKITPVPYFPPWREKGDREKKKEGGVRPEEYYKFIRILFKQPRKTVLNNLREGLKLPQKEVENRLYKLTIPPNIRPANLSMADINKLAAIFSNKRV